VSGGSGEKAGMDHGGLPPGTVAYNDLRKTRRVFDLSFLRVGLG
jgi:hypothetical protein